MRELNREGLESREPPAATEPGRGDAARRRYREERVAHWDDVARRFGARAGWGGACHRRLAEVYGSLIPQGKRVLEIGCGQGDLLASLGPAQGVGVDFSDEMIERARARHPGIEFVRADAHALPLGESFDFIILSDLVNDIWDVQEVFRQARRLSHPATRLVLNFYSRVWELPLGAARRLHLAKPVRTQNWLTVADVSGLLALEDFEVIRRKSEVLLPLRVPPLSTLANRYLAKVFPFNLLTLTRVLVARPVGLPESLLGEDEPTVSVVVPARNEAGNVASVFARTPELGAGVELIFVEGGSTDDTYEVIEREMAAHPERRCLLLRQEGEGKGDAVRLGFAHAAGDVLAILDCDLTVPPEDLPRFVEVLRSGKGDFANGSRLVYPLEREAMRHLNIVGNKFFSLAFSWLLGQPIKDTLCGTKVLRRRDYEAIAANRAHFGDFDPFGDFDLLFGAAKLNLKIMDVPVRYRERAYGATNIARWRHGWLLLRMVAFAARRIKFV
ncbi:MAG: bifunctional class I SAM-dependent methyltransferase/glycosyltransferase family 2 protein [Acidobacteria bacterium]|nr:bifunctional class I SAM-dependent methyltransferase/glycosyltransferase family 2 protein [Acidobacteriota bacterium]